MYYYVIQRDGIVKEWVSRDVGKYTKHINHAFIFNTRALANSEKEKRGETIIRVKVSVKPQNG